MKKIFIPCLLLLLIFSLQPAHAGPFDKAIGNLDNAVGTKQTGLSDNLPATLATVIKAILSLVGTIFLVLIIYAGILWMTAQGADEKVESATKIIKAAVIGLIIVLSAYAITYFVGSQLGGAKTSGATSTACKGTCVATCAAGVLQDPYGVCGKGLVCCSTNQIKI